MTTPSNRLDGKLALVTGAGHGIGQGIARRFAREGAHVIRADLDAAAVETTASAVRAAGGLMEAVALDLTDEDATVMAIDGIGALHGRVDILVAAAAVAAFRWIEEMSLADWRRTLTGELDTVFLATRTAGPG